MKQLRIGSLAHHHASLRDNILRLEYQHPSPSLTPSPQTPYFSPNDISPKIRLLLSSKHFPTRPSPHPLPDHSLPASVFPPLRTRRRSNLPAAGGTPRVFDVVNPRLVGEPFVEVGWILAFNLVPPRPDDRWVRLPRQRWGFLSPTKSWAVFASALVRDCLKSLYIETVDDRWTKADP